MPILDRGRTTEVVCVVSGGSRCGMPEVDRERPEVARRHLPTDGAYAGDGQLVGKAHPRMPRLLTA
jgi:hypothetical protein